MSLHTTKQKIKERRVREHFESIGKNYNSIINNKSFRYYQLRRSRYLSEFCRQQKKNDIVLDLASGTGGYTGSIINYKFLLNIDISLNALNENKSFNQNVSRVNADAIRIPIRDNTIDRIILLGLLHHIPNSLSALFNELNRVLKKGGVVFIDDVNGYNIFWYLFLRFCEIDRIGAAPVFPHRLKKIIERNRFFIEKELYWGLMPPGLSINRVIGLFDKLGSLIERSFFACLCTRYQIILRK